MSREQLLRDVWGSHRFLATRTVGSDSARLPTQLEPHPPVALYIITVYMKGG